MTACLFVLLVGCVLCERGTSAFNEPHYPCHTWLMNEYKNNPSRCHFVHYKSHADCSDTDRLLQSETSYQPHELWHTRGQLLCRTNTSVRAAVEEQCCNSQMGHWSTAARIPISGGTYHTQDTVQVYTTSEMQTLLSKVYKISRLGKALSLTDCSAKGSVENGQHKNIQNCLFS